MQNQTADIAAGKHQESCSAKTGHTKHVATKKCFTAAVQNGHPGALNILCMEMLCHQEQNAFFCPAELRKSHPQRLSAFLTLQVDKLFCKTWLVHNPAMIPSNKNFRNVVVSTVKLSMAPNTPGILAGTQGDS